VVAFTKIEMEIEKFPTQIGPLAIKLVGTGGEAFSIPAIHRTEPPPLLALSLPLSLCRPLLESLDLDRKL
jgi:hypothetical protein